MNKLLSFTKWAFSAIAVVALVFIYSCSDDDPPVVEEVDAPMFSYAATTVEVGTTGSVIPAVTAGDEAAITWAITDIGAADFVTISASTGELSIGAESETGVYDVEVTATNSAGSTPGTAMITISVNSDFDPSGKNIIWKYWMNHTEGVVMENLNTLPGQGDLPPAIPIPVGWPGGVDFQIDPTDPALESYLVFPTVQFFTLQVPGDDACAALDPAEAGDTLLLIVNTDLTISTQCKNIDDKSPGTIVDLGTSSISYDGSAYSWTLNLTIQTIPVAFVIMDAEIEDFTDPLDPTWFAPDGSPRTFTAITGTVDQYLTTTDLADPLSSLELLNVDVVFEIFE